MTQDEADAREAAAIDRYEAMRRAWAPCWGSARGERIGRGRIAGEPVADARTVRARIVRLPRRHDAA